MYLKKTVKSEFLKKQLRFFSYCWVGNSLEHIWTLSSWFKSISDACYDPDTMQGVGWGHHKDKDENRGR